MPQFTLKYSWSTNGKTKNCLSCQYGAQDILVLCLLHEIRTSNVFMLTLSDWVTCFTCRINSYLRMGCWYWSLDMGPFFPDVWISLYWMCSITGIEVFDVFVYVIEDIFQCRYMQIRKLPSFFFSLITFKYKFYCRFLHFWKKAFKLFAFRELLL